MKNDKKTILVFTTAYLPLIGGAELAIHEIMQRMPEYSFVVLTWRHSKDVPSFERMGDVEVHRFGPTSFIGKLLMPFSISRFVFKRKDRNVIMWPVMVTYAGIAAYIVKLFWKDVPMLLTLQEGDSETHLKRRHFGLISFFHSRLIKSANIVQVISEYLKERALAYGAKQVSVVPNGVSVKVFQTPCNEPEEMRDIPKEQRLVSVSRLVEKNGIADIISALPKLPDAHLFLVGGGNLKNKLASLSEQLGVIDRVHFVGIVSNEEVPAYLQHSHTYIRPSLSEGLGTAFFEAMAAGTPVIARSVGGIKDFLVDGETGLSVNSADDIVDAVTRLQNDRELYVRIKSNGIKLVEDKYTWDKVGKRMEALFNKL